MNDQNAWDDLHLKPAPAVYTVGFEIPCAPVAKGRPRFKRVGEHVRTYTPPKTAKFEEVAAVYARAAMGPLMPCASSVQLTFVAFVPVPVSWPKAKRAAALAGLIHPTTRPDLDNYEKALTDALNGIVYDDDSQICDVVKSKRYSDRPRIVVKFHSIDGFAAYRLQPKKTKGAK